MFRSRIILYFVVFACVGSLLWTARTEVSAQANPQESRLAPAIDTFPLELEDSVVQELFRQGISEKDIANYTVSASMFDSSNKWAYLTVVNTKFIAENWENIKPEQLIFMVGQHQQTGWVFEQTSYLNPSPLHKAAPDSFLAEPPSKLSRPESMNYLFPWPSGHAWYKTQGWHWNDNGIDFQPVQRSNVPEHFAVLAAEAGNLSKICDDNVQVIFLINHDDGSWTKYVHLSDANTRQDLNGQRIVRGQYLGLLYSTNPAGVGGYYNTACGEGTAAHLHFGISSRSLSVNGYNLNDVSNAAWATQFTSSNQRVDNNVPSHEILGAFDDPPISATRSGTFRTRGWAKTDHANVTIGRVEVYLNDMYMGNAVYGDYRSDVEGNYGWHWDWPTANYANATYKIQFKAITNYGTSRWLPMGGTPYQNYATVTTSNPTHPCLKPLYRYVHRQFGRHVYTSDWNEINGVGNSAWMYEGVAGHVAVNASCYMPNAKPLYRLESTTTTKHFYTMNAAEKDQLIASGDYRFQNIPGYMATAPQAPYLTAKFYRLYKGSLHDHFYTIHTQERDQAIRDGYTLEGDIGYVFKLGNLKPRVPTLTAPAANASLTSHNVTLSWSDAGDPDNYPRNYRDFEGKIRKDGSTWTQTRAWSQTKTWALTVPSTGKYCWKVQAGDGDLMSGWSAERCFTVVNPPTATPTRTPAPPTPTRTPVPPTPTATPVQGIQGQIDHPAPTAVVTGTVMISGWAHNPQSPIQRVEIWLNDRFIANATYGLPRDDLQGDWHWRWEWNTWHANNGAYRIKVKAISTDGTSRWLGASSNSVNEVPVQVNNRIPPKSLYIDDLSETTVITAGMDVRIRGWAADSAFTHGTGVDTVAIYLDGPVGTGRFIGNAAYGLARSDLLRIYGPRYEKAGYLYTWNTTGILPGEHTLYVYAHSQANGWFYKSRIINVQADTSLACTMSINAGAAYVSQRDVTLSFNVPNATHMLISNDAGFSGTQWQPYESLAAWQLSDIGSRVATVNVYARFRNAQGGLLCNNTSISDDIIYDAVQPTFSALVFAAQQRSPQTQALNIQLVADDGSDGSAVAAVQISESSTFEGAEWQPYTERFSWVLPSGSTVYIRVRDGAGNPSAPLVKQVTQKYQIDLPLMMR